MDYKKQGNSNMPDFKQLSDRVIAEPTDSPTLVIKTNLDSENVTDDNPYCSEEKNSKESKQFRDYFTDQATE